MTAKEIIDNARVELYQHIRFVFSCGNHPSDLLSADLILGSIDFYLHDREKYYEGLSNRGSYVKRYEQHIYPSVNITRPI